MVCLQISAAANLSSLRTVNAAIHLPKLPSLSNFSIPQLSKTRQLIEEFNGSKDQLEKFNNVVLTTQSHDESSRHNNKKSNAIIKLYAVLEAVSDRIEMHHNIG